MKHEIIITAHFFNVLLSVIKEKVLLITNMLEVIDSLVISFNELLPAHTSSIMSKLSLSIKKEVWSGVGGCFGDVDGPGV